MFNRLIEFFLYCIRIQNENISSESLLPSVAVSQGKYFVSVYTLMVINIFIALCK